MKSQSTAAILALLLGSFGIHHFYLGNTVAGVLSLLFCWTFLPFLVSLVNFIQILAMSAEKFNKKYNTAPKLFNAQQAHKTVVAQAAEDISIKIGRLHDLKEKGAITQEEFDAQKKILL
jgi:TM2 domain-containing membrane protein YozV